MNKIIIKDDKIDLKLDNSIIVTTKDNQVKRINIKINDNTDLKIEQSIKNDSKLDIVFEIKENIKVNILDFKYGEDIKVKFNYNLKENSILNVTKFYDLEKVKELDLINLNGENANVNYNLKTISKNKQNFDFIVYHNCKNTISNIVHNGANIKEGKLSFNITGIVYQNITHCVLDQNNRIVTFNENKCNINPNLLIEENDVMAEHSALIGRFSDEEIFYLESRGIPYKQAVNLLVKGFLIGDIEDKNIIKTIDKYWR